MGKLEDMALLVEVAEAGGLSAAGRRLSLSPATMTARLKAIEERYQTRLFHRSTRSITLTRAGEEFYHAALRVLEEMHHAESLLTQKKACSAAIFAFLRPRTLADSILAPPSWNFPDAILTLNFSSR
jgi:DNA-binding transcriptional LysR family regulator